MGLLIDPSQLKGKIKAPPSKSFAHRILIAASLCRGESTIIDVILSEDIMATINCLSALGSCIKINENNSITIKGPLKIKKDSEIIIDCKKSASTMRFLIPIAAMFDTKIKFTGHSSLLKRTMRPILECLAEHKVWIHYNKDNSFYIRGPLSSGDYEIDSSISSQFITGLMFALPMLHGMSTITPKSTIVSSPYIDITVETLSQFGVHIHQKNNFFFKINGNQTYIPRTIKVEGDFSQASFFLIAGAINSKIAVEGLNLHSKQGDKIVLPLLKEIGANISSNQDTIYCCPLKLNPFSFDAKNNPDLVPILSVLAYYCNGKSIIKNVERLTHKESDRIDAILNMIGNMGGCIEYKNSNLEIIGTENKSKRYINTYGDHRIAMSAAIMGLATTQSIIINDYMCVKKSYPDFFEKYGSLGGKYSVIDLEE